jgi:hypothetical protein
MELKPQSHSADSAHEAVIHAVADARGVSPLELETPLFEVIEPDALDRLVDSGTPGLTITFEYEDCIVTVDGENDVTVDPVSAPRP